MDRRKNMSVWNIYSAIWGISWFMGLITVFKSQNYNFLLCNITKIPSRFHPLESDDPGKVWPCPTHPSSSGISQRPTLQAPLPQGQATWPWRGRNLGWRPTRPALQTGRPARPGWPGSTPRRPSHGWGPSLPLCAWSCNWSGRSLWQPRDDPGRSALSQWRHWKWENITIWNRCTYEFEWKQVGG